MTLEQYNTPSEDTAKFQAREMTTQEQLRQLIQRSNDLLDLLRSQRDVLRQRGMNLPSGSLDGLKALKTHLEKLNNQMGATLTELGQLRALADTTALINSTLEPNEVLNQVMDTVIQITGAERGYIAMLNRETGDMEFPVRRAIDGDQLGKGELLVSTTIVNEVASTGEAVLTDNASKEDRYQGHQSIVNFQLRSILAVPLMVRDSIIGVVYCDNRIMAGLFKQTDLNLLKAFANQAAVAIENARLFDALRGQIAQMTEARDLMANIFTSIISGVISVNREDIIMECNPAAERIVGLKREAIIGRPLAEAAPNLYSEFRDKLREARETGSREIVAVEPVVEGLGKRYWNLVMSPLRDELGTTQGAVIVLDDLTEIRQRENQLGIARVYFKTKLDHLRDVSALEVGTEDIISVLHCDVRGFTTFSERLEPGDLMEIINRYMSLSSDAIELYNGVVDKYMGDAVTGLFNTPFNPQEDHALKAVRAAMSMMYDLFALHEVLPEDQRLFYGIGVHTGPAVLGNVGGEKRKEFTGVGDAMDLSKLLQENAEGGEILISAQTYEAVKDYFECEPLTPRKTKGRPDFTMMYKLIKQKKRSGPVDLDSLDF